MLTTLIRKQLLEIFKNYFYDAKTGKPRSVKGLIGFFLLLGFVFVSVGFAVFIMAGGIAGVTVTVGYDHFFFALVSLLAIALGVFGSVFNTYASLYLPKDNELILSLPIPFRTVLLARISGVYAISLLYTSLIWIPSLLAYWVVSCTCGTLTALKIVFPILMLLILALFVTVLTCFLGWLVALFAVKTKGKSFLTVFATLIFLVLYYFLYFKAMDSLDTITDNIDTIGRSVTSKLHYIRYVGLGAAGNPLYFIIALAITVILFALCLFVMSKTLLKIAAAGDTSAIKSKKKASFSHDDLSSALLKRELLHYSSRPTWMLNSGLGILILLVGAAFLLIKCQTVREVLAAFAQTNASTVSWPIVIVAALSMIESLNSVTAAAVSLEGKNLWILQALPIDPWQILVSMERLHLVLNIVPAVLACLAVSFVCQIGVLDAVLSLAAVLLYLWMVADLGLVMNMKHPNLHWKNEAVPVKQSMPVFVVMFGGMFFCGLLGVFGLFFGTLLDDRIVLGLLVILFAVLCYCFRRRLKTKDAACFSFLD